MLGPVENLLGTTLATHSHKEFCRTIASRGAILYAEPDELDRPGFCGSVVRRINDVVRAAGTGCAGGSGTHHGLHLWSLPLRISLHQGTACVLSLTAITEWPLVGSNGECCLKIFTSLSVGERTFSHIW